MGYLQDLVYGRLSRRIRGSAGGLGTHRFVFYGMALAFAVRPSLILSIGCVLVVGIPNVVLLAALLAWSRAERSALAIAEAGD